MSSPYKTFSCFTFGCKVNFADTSMIARQLVDFGCSQIQDDINADICIINTCSVTDLADRKAQKLIKKINKNSPKAKIIVTGCYAQLKPEEISNIKGVDFVVGAEGKLDIDNYLFDDYNSSKIKASKIEDVHNFNSSYSLNERTRAFLKIQDGCSYNCTYCTIPMARGISRSGTIKETINSVEKIIIKDVKEIVLSGINIGDFGIQHNQNLNMLIKELENVNNLMRYRISSIEPNLINDTMINLFYSSNKWAKHLHIPLQSGSNKVLKEMKRRYKVEDYIKLIKKIKDKFFNICIGVDVIVGFPGESEEDFKETYKILEELDVSYLHVFSYSERKNTLAANYINKVQKSDIKMRRTKLQKLSTQLFDKFINENIGQIQSVLFQKYENGLLSGISDNYLKIYAPGKKKYVNKILDVKLLRYDKFMFGEIID